MADLVIPNLTTWSPGVLQGYVGGMPNRTVTVDVGALNPEEGPSGSRSVNDAINAAAGAMLSSGGHLKWPAGTFNVTSMGAGQSNTTISGYSPDSPTTFKVISNYGFTAGTGVVWENNGNPTALVLTGLTQGSTTIYTDEPYTPYSGDPDTFTAGRMVKFLIPNETTTPVMSYTDLTNLRSFIRKIVSWNSGTGALVFTPPLNFDVINTVGVLVVQSQYGTLQNVVVENMIIDGADSGAATANCFDLSNSYNVGFRYVRSVNYNNYGIKLEDTVNTEIYRSSVGAGYGGGSNRSGLLVNRCANACVRHSSFLGMFPNIEVNQGTEGLIFAFNRGDGAWNINHGAFNSYNLYEGNYGGYYIVDGYFGGAGRQTIFRSFDPSGVLISQKRGTREHNLVGNINGTPGSSPSGTQLSKWGLPNIGNEYSNGTSDYDTGSFDIDYNSATQLAKSWVATVISRTDLQHVTLQIDPGEAADFLACLEAQQSATSNLNNALRHVYGVQCTFSSVNTSTGVIEGSSIALSSPNGWPASGSLTIYAGPGGFQSKDLRVALSTFRKGNYYAFYDAFPSGEELGGDTIPDSLHEASKPADWGALDWPAFQSEDPYGTADLERIPVGYYEINGSWPDETPAAPVITLQPVTQTVTEGDDVTLSINATGNPTPTYQWKKGGVDISGKTTRFLTLLDVTTGDAGSYTCVATNSEGTDTSDAAVLTVNAASVSSTPQPRRRSASFGFGFTL